MANANFDRDRADALIQDLGREIIRSPEFADQQWSAIAVVIDLDRQERMYGYRYWNAADWDAAIPSFDTLDVGAELRGAMRVPDQEPWKKCLVQITRATGRVDIDFDYQGDKWAPDMQDPKRFALSLRPA